MRSMTSRVTRAFTLALPVGTAAGLVATPNAAAHGLFLTPALPIPVWLFAVIAAVVVVVSFATIGVLWSEVRWPIAAGVRFFPGLAAASRTP